MEPSRLPHCVTLGKSLSFSGPWHPHLDMGTVTTQTSQATSRADADTHLQANEGEGGAPLVEVLQELPEPQHHRVVNAADVGAVQGCRAWRGCWGYRGVVTPGRGCQKRLWPGAWGQTRPSRAPPQWAREGERTRTQNIGCLETATTISFTGQANRPFSPLNTNSWKERALRDTCWEPATLAACIHGGGGGGGVHWTPLLRRPRPPGPKDGQAPS